jgi:predicted alpha/beta superfamily hydrolase
VAGLARRHHEVVEHDGDAVGPLATQRRRDPLVAVHTGHVTLAAVQLPRGRPHLPNVLLVLLLLVAATLAAWRLQAWRDREEEARLREVHTLAGTVEQHPEFRSALLGQARRVWVYLPPQHAREPERRFPVLYMQDGQNVFDGATAFLAGKEWEVDETAERLIAEGKIEPLVVVAVDNGGERRAFEYLPTRDARTGDGGGADLYGRMLVEELKPWVDARYRTKAGREDTGVAGSSFGAVVSLYVGLRHPDVFGKIAALSISVWVDDRFVVSFVDALPTRPDTRIWMDIGTRESRRAVPDARALRDTLVRKGWREGASLRYVEAEGAVHNETAWAKRVPAVLEFLFPPGT